MPNRTHIFTRFWQELRRRKVLKVIAMYAGAAYVLIELANNVVEPLNLPDWTPRLVIILAVIGFPVVTVLSWIFDLTPGGIVKTEPVESTPETSADEVSPASSGKRKLKASDIIITILLIVVLILAFPRIFRGSANVRTMTMPVTVINEFGEKETRRVFKEDYLSRIAVFPFSNEENDSSASWIRDLVFDAILKDYLQFSNIIVKGIYDVDHLNEQIEYATSSNTSHFLTGTYREYQGNYEVTSRLYQAINGSLLEERTYRGMDLLNLIDSICDQSRRSVGITDAALNATPDLPIRELTTNNLNAYRYYAGSGLYDGQLTSSADYINLYDAVRLDSTFASALYLRAYYNWNFQESRISALKDIDQAMRHRARLPEYDDINVRKLYYLIHDETDKAVSLAEMQNELYPYDYRFLESLTNLYRRKQMFEKAEKALEELNEMVPDHPDYLILLTRSYLYNSKYSKGLELLDKLLLDNPGNTEALLIKGEFYLHMNDLNRAAEIINRAIVLMPEEADTWSLLLDHIEYVGRHKERTNFLNSFTGKYRTELSEQYFSVTINNGQLHFKAENNSGWIFGYEISDNDFVSVFTDQGVNVVVIQSSIRDQNGNVSGFEIRQNNQTWVGQIWKEYPLILKAEELLSDGKLTEALDTFRIASNHYPSHYYLANYIKHLEYIQSMVYDQLEKLFASYAGEYDGFNLYMEDGQFFCTTQEGFIYELLPLDDGTFMIPSIYSARIHMISDGDKTTGLKFVYRDGTEFYYPRTNMQANISQDNLPEE